MTPRILGIDPGLHGAIAFVFGDDVAAHDVPTVGSEVDVDAVLTLLRAGKVDMAVIEAVGSRPGQGVSSTFRFGQAYGALRAAVTACWIPMHLVAPSTWKRHFKLGSDKEQSRALAIRLWPGVGLFNRKADHNRSEACLLARYGAEVLWRKPE